MSLGRKWSSRGDLRESNALYSRGGWKCNRISWEILRRVRLKKSALTKRKTQPRVSNTRLLWRCYLQHASVLSHVVFSLSVFIQWAFFSAVALYNFLYLVLLPNLFLFLSSPIGSLTVGLNSLMLAVKCFWNAALEGQNVSAKHIQRLSTGFGTEQIPYILHYFRLLNIWEIFIFEF